MVRRDGEEIEMELSHKAGESSDADLFRIAVQENTAS